MLYLVMITSMTISSQVSTYYIYMAKHALTLIYLVIVYKGKVPNVYLFQSPLQVWDFFCLVYCAHDHDEFDYVFLTPVPV